MIKKPTKPCWVCGSSDFWQRPDGSWLCNRCHPNPNPGSSPGKEGHALEVLALRDRVTLGNEKLFQAWLQIRELAHDSEEWSWQMDKWAEAQHKLSLLCSELKLKGYTDCLYIENGKKTRSCLSNPDGFWCCVCSSSYPYWEKDLMSL